MDRSGKKCSPDSPASSDAARSPHIDFSLKVSASGSQAFQGSGGGWKNNTTFVFTYVYIHIYVYLCAIQAQDPLFCRLLKGHNAGFMSLLAEPRKQRGFGLLGDHAYLIPICFHSSSLSVSYSVSCSMTIVTRQHH